MKYDYYALSKGLQLIEPVFYDIEFFGLEPWWEPKKPPKPIVTQCTLYEIRDGNSYTVRKLADGNCWMTDNLALGSTEQSYTLTSADTNLSDGETFILPVASAYGTTTWSPGTATDPQAAIKIGYNSEHPK